MAMRERPLYKQIGSDYGSIANDVINPLRRAMRRDMVHTGTDYSRVDRNIRVICTNVTLTCGAEAGSIVNTISSKPVLGIAVGLATVAISYKTALKKAYRELSD